MSNQGFWNRAGRRSGGYRPTEIVVPPTIDCACGTSTPFGLLPRVIVEGCECALCPNCRGVLLADIGGRWVTGSEMAESAPVPAPVSAPDEATR